MLLAGLGSSYYSQLATICQDLADVDDGGRIDAVVLDFSKAIDFIS